MGRLKADLPVLAAAVAAALALAACGSGESADLLPGKTADEITSNLEQVKQRVDERDCVGAEDAVAAVRTEISDLGGVDKKLKANLTEGAERLEEVVAECEEVEPEATETTVETTDEAEEVEDQQKKPKKEKPAEPQEGPAEEPKPEHEGPTLPPQANGKGEEQGNGGGSEPAAPEAGQESPSGGVGPSVGVE